MTTVYENLPKLWGRRWALGQGVHRGGLRWLKTWFTGLMMWRHILYLINSRTQLLFSESILWNLYANSKKCHNSVLPDLYHFRFDYWEEELCTWLAISKWTQCWVSGWLFASSYLEWIDAIFFRIPNYEIWSFSDIYITKFDIIAIF